MLLIALIASISFAFHQFQRAEALQARVELLDGQVNELVRENQRLENRQHIFQLNARRDKLRERMPANNVRAAVFGVLPNRLEP